jgi:hypothetical protein
MKSSPSASGPRRATSATRCAVAAGCASISLVAMLGAMVGMAPAVMGAPVGTNAFVLSGQVRGVFTIDTKEDCVASNLGPSTGTGARVIGFDLTDKAFRPASDKWFMQIYVAKTGTTHFGTGLSKFKVELGAYTPKNKLYYSWLDGPGTVTISRGFTKGSLDATLPPDELGSTGLFLSKATAKETVVGNWDCG